ncbi:MAG: glycosyltransferase, partial [Candidatus Tectomicrobia bacterium]|nr:glycosyltransferase [Candidatus Tectomicrobia bacterium]
MCSIPKIIHQIYFGGESAVREDYRRYRETWLKNHPTWTYRFWDAEQCRQLIAEHYAWFLPCYDAYPHRIQKCDAVRYFILHRYGGLYVDMDIENLKPVDDLVDARDLLLSENATGYTNAIMGSVPGHPLWPLVCETMVQRCERPPFSLTKLGRQSIPHYICRSTGPILLSDCIRDGNFDHETGVRVCPGYV